jgi:Fur family zinc uptake transcriptional regulator
MFLLFGPSIAPGNRRNTFTYLREGALCRLQSVDLQGRLMPRKPAASPRAGKADILPKKGLSARRADTVLSAARRLCQERGARLTPLREEVLLRVLAHIRPVGAYDLMAEMSHDTGRTVAPPTIYRSLEFLNEMGLVSRVESRNAYLACAHPGEEHDCIFAICRNCGQAQELNSDRIETTLRSAARDNGFSPERCIVEVEGLCAGCAAS